MKPHLQQQLALGALLVGAEAKFLSWPRDDVSWFPPRQTGSVEYSDSAVDPVPTSPARQPRDSALAAGFANGLAKRADDVCGYISGDPTWTFGCDDDAFCFKAVNTISSYSMIDCCFGGDLDACTAATTCLDSTDSSLLGSTDVSRTWLCASSEYPLCVTYEYGDGSLSGYSWLNCGKGSTKRTVFESPSAATSATTTSTADSTTDSTTTSTADSTTTSGSSSSPPSTASTSSSRETEPPGPGGSGTDVGAIVGGVVGGVGGIALIAGGIIFCILYSKRKNKTNQMNPPPPPPPGQPQMAAAMPPHHHGGPGGGPPPMMYGGPAPPPVDPRASTMEPGYYYGGQPPPDQQSSYMGSPPGPFPLQQPGGSPQPPYNTGSFDPNQQQQYQQYGAMPPQQAGTPPVPFGGAYGDAQPYQQQTPPPQAPSGHYSELPAVKEDGQLRELG